MPHQFPPGPRLPPFGRQRHGRQVRGWIEAVGEFEALSSLASYCYEHPDDPFPQIDEPTADFTYARIMRAQESLKAGYKPADLDAYAAQAKKWAKRGEVLAYFISGAKVRNPAAAQALIAKLI